MSHSQDPDTQKPDQADQTKHQPLNEGEGIARPGAGKAASQRFKSGKSAAKSGKNAPGSAATASTGQDSPSQSGIGWSQFFIAQGATLLVGLLAAGWFYQSRIVPRLQHSSGGSLATASDATAMEAGINRANDQIITLQKQLDAQREERERTQARLQEMADRMALVIQQTSFVPGAEASRAKKSDASEVAAMMPTVSPSTSELILLKERNRLTNYADQAIATGSRDSLQAIVDTMFDPAMKHLAHACQAEFRRVQNYYDFSSSIDPAYTLPLQELFKDGSVRAEADLTPGQLTALLQDHKQTWENRLRSAYLLRASTDKATNAALIKAIKEDPSLDVAKQAQTTFEKRIGRKFRLFDIPSIEAWWAAQKDK